MNFSNYADFRNKVQTLIDGDDISTSDLSVDVLDLLIGQGEQRIYRDIRSSTQEAALSLTATSNACTLPTDFLELINIYVSGFQSATYVPLEAMQTLVQQSTTTSARSLRYSQIGDTLVFFPKLPDGTVVSGTYYKRFTDISGGLNAFFNRHPDLFVYASLSESAPFLGETARLPIWKQTYTELAYAVNEQERRRKTRGSKLATRVA